jgi:hypothetical protein
MSITSYTCYQILHPVDADQSMSRRRNTDALYQDGGRNVHARRDLNDDEVRDLRQRLHEAEETIENLSQEVEELETRNRALELKNQHLVSALQAEYVVGGDEDNIQCSDRFLECKVCGDEFVFSAGQQEDYDRRGLKNDPARCKDCKDLMRDGRSSQGRKIDFRPGSFRDRALHCKDCGNKFLFTADQQEDYDRRGLHNDPARCKDCRAANRSGDSFTQRDVPRDKRLDCRDCGSQFVFSVAQQEDYERRGLVYEPARCKVCRNTMRGKHSRHDKVIRCKDCSEDFVFTVAQQEGYEKRGLQNDPTRCQDCRAVLRGEKSHSSEGGILTENAPLLTPR